MNLVVVLYNLRSAHNVGAIFRTADALQAAKMFLAGTTPVPGQAGKSGRELAKTALGAENFVFWKQVKAVGVLLKTLKKEGFQLLALEQDKQAQDIRKYRLPKNKKVALIVGYEIKGIPTRILRQCDKIIQIPMFGRKESLNVSVAFGVAGYFLKLTRASLRNKF